MSEEGIWRKYPQPDRKMEYLKDVKKEISKLKNVLQEHYKRRIKKSEFAIKCFSPDKEDIDDLEFYKGQLKKLEGEKK